MTVNATAVYRIRAGGLDSNGGGYDSAISGALSTTLNGSISAGATTVVVASATGWPASGNYYARIGATGAEAAGGSSEIVQVTGGQGTTSWTITRAQLGTSALAFASGIAVDNNLSQCDTKAFVGTVGTSNASTTFIDATGAFNETVVGNVLWLASGTNGTVGAYFIAGYTNSTTITLDRNCSTGAMTNGAWKVGGAWIDFANLTTSTWIVAGCTVFIRGAGTDNPSAADYTVSSFVTLLQGSLTAGRIHYIGENGRPQLNTAGLCFQNGHNSWYENLKFKATAATNNRIIGTASSIGWNSVLKNIVCDQNNFDISFCKDSGAFYIDCIVYSSAAISGGTGTLPAYDMTPTFGSTAIGCVAYRCKGPGFALDLGSSIHNCLSAYNAGDGVAITTASARTDMPIRMTNCTTDANSGHGVVISNDNAVAMFIMASGVISNHTSASKYGLFVNNSRTATVNDRLKNFIDYNDFYNNNGSDGAGGMNQISGSQPDNNSQNLNVDPQYTNATSTIGSADYSVGVNLKAKGFPGALTLASILATTGYLDIGAIQRQEPTGGGAGPFSRIFTGM